MFSTVGDQTASTIWLVPSCSPVWIDAAVKTARVAPDLSATGWRQPLPVEVGNRGAAVSAAAAVLNLKIRLLAKAVKLVDISEASKPCFYVGRQTESRLDCGTSKG